MTPTLHPAAAPSAAAADAQAGLRAKEARALEGGSTGFGPTVFDVGSDEVQPAGAGSAFDVCHVGAVLRALLFVHAVVGVAVVFNARDFASWLTQLASSSSVALPAVLLWLLVACGLKRPLSALPLYAQWATAIVLGAFSGGIAAQLAGALVPEASSAGAAAWLGPGLSGGAIAAVIFQWLHMRAQARLPAETTARLAELQSRIRPHFLFNTLNTALALVRLDPTRAELVLEDLAELFRVAIGDSGESVSLTDEVDLAQRYLAIEQLRFGTRLQVDWDLDADAGCARVPPLLLQPLVENAVRHGVEPAAEGGVIRVRTRVRHGRAVISIVNSMPVEPSRPGNGMALRNVRERLHLMHDVAAQFDTRHDTRVFRVQMVVPL